MKKTARLGLRVTPLEKTYWEKEARSNGYSSTAAWITSVLNREAKLEIKPPVADLEDDRRTGSLYDGTV